MENTTQELIYQLMALIAIGILAILGAYLKKLIQTKINIQKYGFENDRVERIIDNAINFAEQKAKEYSKIQSEKIASNEKLTTAKLYIDKVDKNIIEKFGTQLDDMITRKVAQKFGV
jgi:hypothetical protein